ncbi:SpoIIE family protein phosphatase [Streptomyces sp. DSM 41972]|uniref:SpoIIE family protein phosphatase n=1 Tax=Streptomyces althioticus subsp. attaecolombicae TaxID=3075534 RepID=A0ABU3I5B9_9ACTN|nr:SpoIIE family protein phosphatase [Streptomyces sp. DSM 41972]SCE08943.1 Anti-sigma regulatory factor (Ser/Thr protein kinase) [Streptomyces sp. di50b]SCE23090.1 Anti-sigma regulatory factor (Ser/Thr protein kinase) [Streptomyces sp. di188]
MPRVWHVPVHDATRVRDVRVAAEEAAARAGLDEQRRAACALVATELATNLVNHAKAGEVVVDVVDPAVLPEGWPGRAVQITALDHGPGIADVAGAFEDGFTTGGSLGAGLGTCRRIADAFSLHSEVGRGTVAVARVGPATVGLVPAEAPARSLGVHAGGVNVPFAGAEQSGDAWSWVRSGDRVTLMLADGLGHGAEAARASDTAVEELRHCARLPPAELLQRLHTALSGTRGAAVAAAQLDTWTGRLRFAGIGNVTARLRDGGRWRTLLSRPGIVGAHRPRTVREDEAEWTPGSLLILHTDGLSSRWTPPAGTGVPPADPAVTAAVAVRDAGSAARPVRDDTAVAVLANIPEASS